MQFEKELVMMNGVYYLSIPIDLVRYLGLTEKSTIIIKDEDGKHGKYASFWEKTEENKGR